MEKLQVVAALELTLLRYLQLMKSVIAVVDYLMIGLVEQLSKFLLALKYLACRSLHVLKSI